jgi:hypothetical protein
MKKVNVFVTQNYQVEVPDNTDVNLLDVCYWDSRDMILENVNNKYEKFHGEFTDTIEVTITQE